MSWLTKNVGGHTKRAMAVGFAMGIGQIGGIVAPLVSVQLKENLRSGCSLYPVRLLESS
jgi:hypothetical protein